MEAHAQIFQPSLVPTDLARLGLGNQAAGGELAPRSAQARRERDPDDRLQIAQAARAFLDVGLEVVRRVLVAQMALLLLENLGFEKRAHVDRLFDPLREATVEGA